MSPEDQSQDQDQRQRREGRAGRHIGGFFRGRYLVITAITLAVAMSVALVPRTLSGAATTSAAAPADTSGSQSPNDDNITWNPGDVRQGSNSGGGCWTNAEGTADTGSSDTATALFNAIQAMPSQSVNADGTTSYGIGSTSITGANDTILSESQVDCSIVQAAFRTGHVTTTQLLALTRPAGIEVVPAPGTAAGALTPASDPKVYLTAWYKGAVADIAATMAYIAVGTVLIGTMISLGAAIAGGELASAVLGTLAGCVGGAVSTGILLYIGGGDNSALSTVSNVVTGCLTGAALANIPITKAGAWLSATFGALFGTETAVVGGAVDAAAASAGVEMSPVSQAISDAAAGFANAAGG